MTRISAFRALVLALALAGCAPAAGIVPPPPPPAPAEQAWVADRLFFGRSIPGGGTVSDGEWAEFVRDVVTPRFPDGLTVWHGQGQWRDATGQVLREDVTVVEIFHPAGTQSDAALREIANEYKRRFRQESVLRVRGAAGVEFMD
ncbi:MAG TPA: DUF3574 domain-containing protein [Longimicrobium sp.]|nr:DUF3574 domain-containing protein [Longimicrobium sp.]